MDIVIIMGVVLIALIVQFIVEALKLPVTAVLKFNGKEDRYNPLFAPFLSIAWCIALCILAGCDLFVAFGYPLSVPYVGAVASGIIASLGAGKVYDLVVEFKDYRERLAVEKTSVNSTDEFTEV